MCDCAFAAVARPTTHELASHGLWFEWCRKSLQILKLFAALHIFLACKNSCFYICGCQVSTCLLMPGPCFTGLLPVCIGMYSLLLQVATRSLQLHFHIGPIITVGGQQYITSVIQVSVIWSLELATWKSCLSGWKFMDSRKNHKACVQMAKQLKQMSGNNESCILPGPWSFPLET